MANTYSYIGPGTRWSAEDPTSVDRLNVSRQNNDHTKEALSTITNTAAADGNITLATGSTINFASGDIVLTHSSNTLTLTGGTGVGFAAAVTLPFYTVVSGETIQTQVNAAEAAGGGVVMVGPGTYNENVLIDSDNVSLIGAGWGCTTINGAAAGYAVKIAADHCRVEGFTVNTTAGGGHADGEGVWIAAGSYNVVAFCRSVTSDKTAFFGNGAGTRNMWLHNVIPADNHDGYAAIDSSLSGDDNLIMGNIVQSGGLLGYTSGGDYTVMVGNILDGNGANSYGYILGTAAANSLMVGNISHDVSSTDFWDQGGTGTNTANEVL